jgi:hypothetical protein
MGRPPTGQTPVRTVRLGDVWDEARANAEAEGHTMTDLVDRLLRRYNAARRREQHLHHRDGNPRNNDVANLELRETPEA